MLGSYAQVGIGTTNPQETLHVVGSVRVESSPSITDPVGLVGADDENTNYDKHSEYANPYKRESKCARQCSLWYW